MLAGILLDVSGSMQNTYEKLNMQYGQQTRPWIESIFGVIENIAKYDINQQNEIFAFAFGAKKSSIPIDLISTLKKYNKQQSQIGYLNKQMMNNIYFPFTTFQSNHFNYEFILKFQEPGPNSIYNCEEALKILKQKNLSENLSNHRIQQIMHFISPFIFGNTPMNQALQSGLSYFSQSKYENSKKLLFVLSDGAPDDKNDHGVIQKLKKLGVTIVSLLVSNDKLDDPLHLYNKPSSSWSEQAKYLFNLASQQQVTNLPSKVFIQNGWKIDHESNSIKLFLQINHPIFIENVSKFSQDVICQQDALRSALYNINLELYINSINKDIQVTDQYDTTTCFAHASASVIHLALKRIEGRVGGYPSFQEIKDNIINKFGSQGNKTQEVLKQICPQYRLHVKQVDVKGAKKAIIEKRPVVARIKSILPSQTKILNKFFQKNPKGIITQKQINIYNRNPKQKKNGHALVLTSFDSSSLRFMNSWGTKFGDNGFFRTNEKVFEFEFFDVYWELEDLLPEEIQYFNTNQKEILTNKLNKLTGLRNCQYQCNYCKKLSLVSNYESVNNDLYQAICPRCHKSFNVKGEGNMLFLYKYLVWFCQSEKQKIK